MTILVVAVNVQRGDVMTVAAAITVAAVATPSRFGPLRGKNTMNIGGGSGGHRKIFDCLCGADENSSEGVCRMLNYRVWSQNGKKCGGKKKLGQVENDGRVNTVLRWGI